MKHTSELTNILNQNFMWSKPRIDCFVNMLLALILSRTVNLAKISCLIGSKTKISSRYRRLQRFFQHFKINPGLIARFVFQLFGFDKVYLTRTYDHLPVVSEIQEIAEHERLYPCCNAPYADIGATEDSRVIEIEVQAHIRRIKRKKYHRTCCCASEPVMLTAFHISKMLSKSCLGNFVWIHCLTVPFFNSPNIEFCSLEEYLIAAWRLS